MPRCCITSTEREAFVKQAVADESYAVANAHEELKRYATNIILSNDEDGVAKWLAEKFDI